MKRRSFVTTVPAAAGFLSLGGWSSALAAARSEATGSGGEAPSSAEREQMLSHCRRLLEQNLLKDGERLVVATSHQYDEDFIRGLLLAGSEIGAVGGHIAVLPRKGEEVWFSEDAGASRGLTPWHWNLYAAADLLIVASPRAGARTTDKLPYSSGILPVMTSYESKLGDHPYRTDFEMINREGSRTRWLKLGGSLETQRKHFPTIERKELTLRAARAVHGGKVIRVTSRSGSDFSVRKEGRPAHAQYGIADVPGRWDNFGYGCVVIGPEEYTAEGVLVVEPGDMMQSYPKTLPSRERTLTEGMRVTFEGGYVTEVEGGEEAKKFYALLESFNNKESFGTSHIGFGTHEETDISELGFAAHNMMGSILFSLGANHGHGLGGEALNFSGMGLTTRKAPSHTHVTVYGQDFYCDGQKLVEGGKLLL